MTAPLTDARLAEIEALAASTYSGGDLHAARFIGALCADVRELLAALAQCREERDEALAAMASDGADAVLHNAVLRGELAQCREEREALRDHRRDVLISRDNAWHNVNAIQDRLTAATAALADAREGLKKAEHFIDWEVRAMLPNEHGNCGSGCAHAAGEAEDFDALDKATEAIRALLAGEGTKP